MSELTTTPLNVDVENTNEIEVEEQEVVEELAQRLLGAVFTDVSFYIARDLQRSRHYPGAQASLELALMIRPREAVLWYQLARVLALQEREEDAISALKTALEHGWSDWERLANSPEFSKLRSTESWKNLEEKYRGKQESQE